MSTKGRTRIDKGGGGVGGEYIKEVHTNFDFAPSFALHKPGTSLICLFREMVGVWCWVSNTSTTKKERKREWESEGEKKHNKQMNPHIRRTSLSNWGRDERPSTQNTSGTHRTTTPTRCRHPVLQTTYPPLLSLFEIFSLVCSKGEYRVYMLCFLRYTQTNGFTTTQAQGSDRKG